VRDQERTVRLVQRPAPDIRALPVRQLGLECVVWRNGTNRATGGGHRVQWGR
jgi:hypothetical protein